MTDLEKMEHALLIARRQREEQADSAVRIAVELEAAKRRIAELEKTASAQPADIGNAP